MFKCIKVFSIPADLWALEGVSYNYAMLGETIVKPCVPEVQVQGFTVNDLMSDRILCFVCSQVIKKR